MRQHCIFFGELQWNDNPGYLKGKRPKLYAVTSPLVDPKVQEFELKEEISTQAVVHFESRRGGVQRIPCLDTQDRTQVFSRGYEACLYCDTAQVFELGGTSISHAHWEEVFDNCTSLNEQGQLELMPRVSKMVVSWEPAEVFTVPKPTKKKAWPLHSARGTHRAPITKDRNDLSFYRWREWTF